MKKKYLIQILALVLSAQAYAQVKDISVTFSPAAEYTLWDNKAGIEDGFLVGGKIGFGFGEYIELRATYMQDLDLKTNFEDFGLINYSNDFFTARDIKLTRIGGEFKANFGTKTKLNPYLTLGSGVQAITLENQDKQEQIFATLGLGAKFNLGKRTVFAIEAKNTTYNFNSGLRLLTEDDKLLFGVTDEDFESENLSNWSAMASLQFYLSGRRPGELTELDRAYINSFSGGFKGLRFVVEPGLSNIKFDDDSNFRDTWLLGASLGLDFNEYLGLRGFYYKATNNEEISTDFDDLSMYGGEFIARLNVDRGVVPYIALGGGYLNTDSNYIGKDGLAVDDTYFASGGLGLSLSLTKGLHAFGGVKAILTSGTNEEDLQSPDEIQTHTMYNFGLRLEIGKKAKSATTVYNDNLNVALSEQQTRNDEKLAKLKAEYNSKIKKLETELNVAYQLKDVDKAVEILEEKKEVEKALKEVEAVEEVSIQKKEIKQNLKVAETKPQIIEASRITEASQNKVVTNKEPMVQMSPVEFELLVTRILNEVEGTESAQKQIIDTPTQTSQSKKDDQILYLNQRIDVLEKLLLEVNASQLQPTEQVLEPIQNNDDKRDDLSRQILKKLDELNRKVERNSDRIEMKQSDNDKPQTITIESELVTKEKPQTIVIDSGLAKSEKPSVKKDSISIFSKLKFKDASAFAGGVFGNEMLPVIGLRLNYAIDNSKIEFMPELFFGITDPFSYGLSGNGIIPINIKNTTVKPYAGAGIGFMNIYGDNNFNANLIVGSYLNLLEGKLYVDFTTRNFFNYNQISAGYKFKF